MCKAKGLISTGRKNVLIVRIRAHQKPIDVPDMQLPSVAMVPSIGSIDIASVAPGIQPITPKLSGIEVPTDVAQHVHSTSPPAPLGVEPLGAADQLSSATATAIAPLLDEAQPSQSLIELETLGASEQSEMPLSNHLHKHR